METLGSEAPRRRLPELLERARQDERTAIPPRGVPVAALPPFDLRIQGVRMPLPALRGSGRGRRHRDVPEEVHQLRRECS